MEITIRTDAMRQRVGSAAAFAPAARRDRHDLRPSSPLRPRRSPDRDLPQSAVRRGAGAGRSRRSPESDRRPGSASCAAAPTSPSFISASSTDAGFGAGALSARHRHAEPVDRRRQLPAIAAKADVRRAPRVGELQRQLVDPSRHAPLSSMHATARPLRRAPSARDPALVLPARTSPIDLRVCGGAPG